MKVRATLMAAPPDLCCGGATADLRAGGQQAPLDIDRTSGVAHLQRRFGNVLDGRSAGPLSQ